MLVNFSVFGPHTPTPAPKGRLLHAKFHPIGHWCNVSPLRGENLKITASNRNTGAMLRVKRWTLFDRVKASVGYQLLIISNVDARIVHGDQEAIT